MDLMDTAQLLGSFGEFVGAFAVVATLFYLAAQVRQNRIAVDASIKATEENTVQIKGEALARHAESIGEWRSHLYSNREVFEIWHRGLDNPDELEDIDEVRPFPDSRTAPWFGDRRPGPDLRHIDGISMGRTWPSGGWETLFRQWTTLVEVTNRVEACTNHISRLIGDSWRTRKSQKLRMAGFGVNKPDILPRRSNTSGDDPERTEHAKEGYSSICSSPMRRS